MKKTKFSEWVADRHPEYQQLDEAWPFSSSAEDRLSTITRKDRRSLRDNPAPRAISSDRNIQGIATEFMAAVKDAVNSNQADSVAVQKAAARAAGTYLSPRAANELFMAAALRSGPMGLQTVAKHLFSMTKAGSSMRTDDPTLKGGRDLRRASVEKEISEGDRARINELLTRFLNSLIGPGSGPTATPAE